MPVPSRDTLFNFLLIAYLGEDGCPLSRCIKRAYLDLSRTLRDIAKSENNPRLDAEEILRNKISDLRDQPIADGRQFDEWHRDLCCKLKKTYADAGYAYFTVGQAQKWINMTLKYIYVMGEKYMPGYTPLYELCHAPLDSRLVDRLKEQKINDENLYRGDWRWSKLNDYDAYLKIQDWIRERLPPLDYDFRYWPKNPRAPESSSSCRPISPV